MLLFRRDGALFDPWAFYSGPQQENMSPGLDKNCWLFDLQETFKEKGGTKLKALDQLWSSQDEHQVIGHVQQKGQTKKVTVVWLLADGTTDTLLHQFAQGKARQSETFVSKAKAFLALNNNEDSDGDTSDSEVDNHSPSIVQVKGKGTSHKRKRSNDVADKGKKQKTKGGEVPLPLDVGRSSPIDDGSLDLSGDVHQQKIVMLLSAPEYGEHWENQEEIGRSRNSSFPPELVRYSRALPGGHGALLCAQTYPVNTI
ncbi:uncharacterized protein EI90DRAFT_3128767 [Cantharellus anzutake]|uniref:uncharacterized protein n=1 Tax=Cantharellus anzutake TaxID=1750568 RepID=UPI00190726A6|nr:uncharacterized protein EI90DRAFT_3128767 [Cantharellus anzutake]KAF8325414.1 hypothetical protein EI90DRAFT_3128767 [Cantharellus anzutake]